jgi:phosphate transport system permease protein
MISNTEDQRSNRFAADRLEHSYSNPKSLAELALTALAFILLGIALLPLLLVISYVTFKGASQFSLSLFTETPPTALQKGGGIGSAILGTLMLLGIASVISIPFGILAALYLSEFSSGKIAPWVRFATNVLSGVPSIIIGIFAYGVLVITMGHFSALAGGFALGILMLPIVVRTADEALQLVPQEVRWASVGVGASRYQTVLQIVLPAALPSILTGTTLAIARAAGETAPLIFTVLFNYYWPHSIFQPVPALSVLIYDFASVPYEHQQQIAWAASLVLVLLILITSIISRLATRRRIY